MIKVLSIFVFLLCFSLNTNAFLKQGGKHSVVLGVGHVNLFNDFEDYGEAGIIPTLGYYYGRENKFYPLVDLHFFKQKYKQSYFSSKSFNFSIGFNYFNFDSLYFSPFGGLGFYIPKSSRVTNGTTEITESKLVFGVTLGLETYLKLNEDYGASFRYQYHNPFDSKQDNAKDLEGHYTITSINLSRGF